MVDKKYLLKQHFTDAPEINALMCQLLGPVHGLKVLEPAVGQGAFLRGLSGRPSRIDAVDIDQSVLDVTAKDFAHLPIRAICGDFIDLFSNDLFRKTDDKFDDDYGAVISNPPYGLYFHITYRRQLKRKYPDLYVRESYGLFFVFSITQLREDGRYVFLLPDTFLASRNHRPLRDFICKTAAPTHIVRFPSKRFESVNFGYANLCIVAGNKRPLTSKDEICWCDVFENHQKLDSSIFNSSRKVLGSAALMSSEAGWSPAEFERIDHSYGVDSRYISLGSIADCKTGIYTGENARFIGFDPANVNRRLNGHAIDPSLVIDPRTLTNEEKQLGVSRTGKTYVPLIRGGHRVAFDKTPWAIDWSKEAIQHYKTNPKARFQNATFYFARGLSVPMVTTKRISAAFMENSVFDQGVVGVFPRNEDYIAPLLLYLNSAEASKRLKRMTNGGANNSANYLKRLPVPNFSDDDIRRASKIVTRAMAEGRLEANTCDAFVASCQTYQAR